MSIAPLQCVTHLLRVIVTPQSPIYFFFLMIRRPPRSTLDRSSAASDVYKRQPTSSPANTSRRTWPRGYGKRWRWSPRTGRICLAPVSYTHLRAHETVLDLVCRLLLAKKKLNCTAVESTQHNAACASGNARTRLLSDTRLIK